jgi:hypothetical protein
MKSLLARFPPRWRSFLCLPVEADLEIAEYPPAGRTVVAVTDYPNPAWTEESRFRGALVRSARVQGL